MSTHLAREQARVVEAARRIKWRRLEAALTTSLAGVHLLGEPDEIHTVEHHASIVEDQLRDLRLAVQALVDAETRALVIREA
ncbi:MAG: hypothetical protein ACODAJ_05590 [Planctomycetota bacterium]